jgi:c-di-GMP-binding flagellar brake protein YcgR
MSEPVIPLEAELTLFRNPTTLQRRRDRRYRCSLATSGKLQFEKTGETVSAWVSNLSRGGVGLDLQKQLPAGQEFVLLLRNVENGIVRLFATVAHSTPIANGGWRIGARFSDKITAELLETLL